MVLLYVLFWCVLSTLLSKLVRRAARWEGEVVVVDEEEEKEEGVEE
jgi:hypothetical protein